MLGRGQRSREASDGRPFRLTGKHQLVWFQLLLLEIGIRLTYRTNEMK
jgi:hypothetical protein